MKNKLTLDYKIKVISTPDGPRPELYDGSTHIPQGTIMRTFNKTNDDLRKIGHYRLEFELEDTSQLRFIPNQADVMWAQKGNQCPRTPCSLPSEFWVDYLHPQGKRVEIINMDMTNEEFWFTLNFCDPSITNPTPADYIPLDPGGGNQNTGGIGSGFESYAMVGALSGAMAGLASAALMDRGFVAQNLLVCVLVGAALGLVVGLILRNR